MPDALPCRAWRDEAEEPTNSDLLAAVNVLASEIRELRAAIAPDLAQRAAVLVALHAEFADANFTALDALERAAALPESELASALVTLTGGPVGGLRRLSRRLAKLTGKPAGGRMLIRIGDDHGSSLYAVQTGQ